MNAVQVCEIDLILVGVLLEIIMHIFGDMTVYPLNQSETAPAKLVE